MPAKVLGGIDYSRLSDKIWSYPIRTVTKYVDVNDRGHGYVSDKVAPYVVMRERRGIKGGTKFMLVGNTQPFFLGDETNDLLPSAKKEILWDGFDDTKLRDHDDDTYSYPRSDEVGGTFDLVKYDFRSIGYRFVFLKTECGGCYAGISINVLISNDDVTYNVLAQDTGTSPPSGKVYGATFRYIKLGFDTKGRRFPGSYLRYYSVEVYWPSTTSILYYPNDTCRLVQCYVNKGYYLLLEAIGA